MRLSWKNKRFLIFSKNTRVRVSPPKSESSNLRIEDWGLRIHYFKSNFLICNVLENENIRTFCFVTMVQNPRSKMLHPQPVGQDLHLRSRFQDRLPPVWTTASWCVGILGWLCFGIVLYSYYLQYCIKEILKSCHRFWSVPSLRPSAKIGDAEARSESWPTGLTCSILDRGFRTMVTKQKVLIFSFSRTLHLRKFDLK